jgi:TolB-like protein/Flp pilus assembly protein TadD
MGEQNVKNIARPVRAYALRPEGLAALPAPRSPARPSRRGQAIIATVAAAVVIIVCVAWWFWPAAKTTSTPAAAVATAGTASIAKPLVAPRLSIVVLPFANLSNDADQQYFADAITEDLTTDLSQISDMFVIARNTAFTYRNKAVDARQIGRELGVRFVLEGSVQRSGNKVRITTQLIDAETNAHLWAERFDRDIGDLLALQNEITSRIAITLSAELLGVEASRPRDQRDALDFILRGRAVGLKPMSPSRYDEAIGYFERALALDPGSAEATALLASSLAGRVLEGMTNTRDSDIERVVKLADQALATSPRNPIAHYAKGQALRAQGRYAAAIPEYETAIAFRRNWVIAMGALADCKLVVGPIEDVIPLQEQALRLSPRDPYDSNMFNRIGMAHLLQSHTDEAIVWLEKARDTNPVRVPPHSQLASAYALKGERERAAQELAEARNLAADDRFSSISHLKALGAHWGPNVLPLVQATYWEGLRKAGVPDE